MPTGRAYRSTEARRQRPQEALGRAEPGGHARRWVGAYRGRLVARGRSVLAILSSIHSLDQFWDGFFGDFAGLAVGCLVAKTGFFGGYLAGFLS